MCSIVDADVVYQLVGPKQTEPGRKFRQWLDGGRGELVIGGKNTRELTHNKNFERWFLEGRRLGRRVRQIRESMIKEAEEQLSGRIRSNDRHVLALALVSGARLLFTDDRRLTNDFVNTEVIWRCSPAVSINGRYSRDAIRSRACEIFENSQARSSAGASRPRATRVRKKPPSRPIDRVLDKDATPGLARPRPAWRSGIVALRGAAALRLPLHAARTDRAWGAHGAMPAIPPDEDEVISLRAPSRASGNRDVGRTRRRS